MSDVLTQLALYAATRSVPMRSIADRLNRPLSIQFYVLAGAATVLVIFTWLAIAHAYRKRHEPPAVFSEDGLLGELADAHQLPGDQRRLLGEMADGLGLPSATHLFVRPSRFHAAAAGLVGSPPSDDAVDERIESLHERLFGRREPG